METRLWSIHGVHCIRKTADLYKNGKYDSSCSSPVVYVLLKHSTRTVHYKHSIGIARVLSLNRSSQYPSTIELVRIILNDVTC